MFSDKIIINDDLDASPQIINSKNNDKNVLDDTLSASEVYVSRSKLKNEQSVVSDDIKKDFVDVLKIVKELIKQNSVLKEKINDLNKKISFMEEHNRENDEKYEKKKHNDTVNLHENNIKRYLEEYNTEIKKNIADMIRSNMVEIMRNTEKNNEDKILKLFVDNVGKMLKDNLIEIIKSMERNEEDKILKIFNTQFAKVLKDNMIDMMKNAEQNEEDKILKLFDTNFTKICQLIGDKRIKISDENNSKKIQPDETNNMVMNRQQKFKKMMFSARK